MGHTRIILFDYIKVVMKSFIIITHVGLITTAMREYLFFPFWIDQAVPFFWVISAFLFYISFQRHGSAKARDELKRRRLIPRLNRVLFPYVPIFILITVLSLYRGLFFANSTAITGLSFESGPLSFIPCLLIDFICGGFGQGGYYIPMLFQMYILLPFLSAAYSRSPIHTGCAVVTIVFAWEYFVLLSGIVSPQVYRLVILRYGLYLLAGTVLGSWYLRGQMGGGTVILSVVMMMAGGVYLYAINCLGMPPLSGASWQNTSSLSVLWVAGFLLLVMTILWRSGKAGMVLLGKELDCRCSGVVRRIRCFFETISRAALHIYIFQMLYFYFMNNHLDWLSVLTLPGAIAASVLICTCGGLLHYKMDNFLKSAIAIKKRI